MDHRGSQPWPESGRHSHRSKDREDYHRYSQQDRDQSYPPVDPRERDRHWAHPDARHRAQFTSPPARPEQYPYSTQQYPYSYGRPEHHRPQSRCVWMISGVIQLFILVVLILWIVQKWLQLNIWNKLLIISLYAMQQTSVRQKSLTLGVWICGQRGDAEAQIRPFFPMIFPFLLPSAMSEWKDWTDEYNE